MTYTREQILNMPVGSELDIVVATEIMGYTTDRHRQGLVSKGRQSTRPIRYSSDISAAIEAAEKVGTYQLTKIGIGPYPYRAIVKANKHVVNAETAPEAICKASLLAVMGL